MKKIITLTLLCTIFIGIVCFSYFSTRTVKNEDNAIGNTASNLLNGGLFCENDGKIYFSNPNDDGALYVMNSDMSNFKKLSNDNCSYINATNHYLIYVRDNHARKNTTGEFFNFNTVGIFRLDKKNGNNIKQLYGKPAGLTSLKGNYVYYQHYNAKEGLHFYQVDIDSNHEKELLKEAIAPASFGKNCLYYNGVDNDHDIHSMNLDTKSISTVYSGNCYNIVTTDNYIYFLSLSNDYAIARANLDGSHASILEKERCSFFNLSPDEKYLYYQVDGGDNNRLCRMNLATLETEPLKEGNFNSIHVTDHYVFFRKFDTNHFYYITTATGKIERFNPDVLD
ncbi:MAG: DUF5050 domain-containing protein [Velocimicrobium sp.]